MTILIRISNHSICVQTLKNSLHYVQIYGVKGYSAFSSKKHTETNIYSILLSSKDHELMKSDFTVLISRNVHNNLAFCGEDFKKLVVQHIPHKYSKEMFMKSEAVSSLMR